MPVHEKAEVEKNNTKQSDESHFLGKEQKKTGSLTSVTLRKPEKSATTFPCVSMTPFGFPVSTDRKHKHTDITEVKLPSTCLRIPHSTKGNTKGIWHGKTNLGFVRNSSESYSHFKS